MRPKETWVLLEVSALGRELFFRGFSDGGAITRTTNAAYAMKFPSAAEAYEFGLAARPQLDWWRVARR